jgi:hypothetical protein
VASHRSPHDAESDETDLRHVYVSVSVKCGVPATLSARNRETVTAPLVVAGGSYPQPIQLV